MDERSKQKTQQLFLALRGRAIGAIRQPGEWKTMPYKDLVKRLEEMFGGQEEMYLAQFKGRQQNSQETIQAFAQVIRKLTDSAYAGMPEQSWNRIARDHFLENLRDREVRSAVHLTRPATMEEAVRSALETEAFLATERQRYPKFTRMVETTKGDQMAEVTSLLKKLLEKQKLLEKRGPENNEEQAYQNHRERNEAVPQGQRWYRNRNGRGRGRGTPSGYNRARGRGRGCFECGAFDHYIAACPHLPGRQRSMNGGQCPGNDDRPDGGAPEGSQETTWAPIQ